MFSYTKKKFKPTIFCHIYLVSMLNLRFVVDETLIVNDSCRVATISPRLRFIALYTSHINIVNL